MSLLKRLNEKNIAASSTDRKQDHHQSQTREGSKSKETELKVSLQNHLISELKKKPDLTDNGQKELIELEAMKYINEKNDRLSFEAKKELIEIVSHELIGYGPITALLNESDVSEIMVNGPDQIYVERNGKLMLSDHYFRDNEHVLQVIEKIVSPLGRRIDESSPMVDARLPDGSRVNAIIPPLSLVGPVITIRKFPQNRLQISDLINFNSLTEHMSQFLDACVKARLNIFISGGTGSGKTSLLNILSSFIPHDERIVTIEDAAELQLLQDHVVSLETRPPNVEGKGAVSIRDLVKNSLRMRPDRIVIGEVRGGEALDMLQAMNTGHDGSLATGHSNSPREMLSRLETMVLMAGMDLPIRAIREQMAGAVDLIIQQSRLKDGSRKVINITEVIGMEGETIVLQDLFVFRQTGTTAEGKVIGQHTSTGIRPYCSDKLEQYGFELPATFFVEKS
ncbi:type II secretion system protein E [Anaerobacillus alkalilacustris]|uniref:Type II secretion system protein E n=1 Tax=Anaerobacillus alkalilacustris TaxID=393763 RepID=A0A1S2LEV3_9BACI|nr:CpaF family protein [Anaerobacillus alkalilacustris]OIJ11052.1 type II secretion system protein E [Anaerobacillus alkalilacustris]